MMTLKELRDRLEALEKTYNAAVSVEQELSAKEDPNDDERLAQRAASATVDDLGADITTAVQELQAAERVREHERVATLLELGIRATPDSVPPPPNGGFANLGEQIIAVYNAGLPNGPVDDRLVAAATGMGEGIPSDGGFLVQHDLAAPIIREAFESGQILQRVTQIPIGPNFNGVKIPTIDETSRVTGSRFGGVQMFYLDEGGTPTQKKAKIRHIKLELKKLVGLWHLTEELMADTVAMGNIAEIAFREELRFMLEDMIVEGTGVGQPLGFLNSNALITVAKETGQLANTITIENITKMWARMPAKSKRTAVWLINTDTTPELYTMGITFGTGGQAVFMPPGGISGAPFATIYGRPVIEIEFASTLGTKGDIMLVDLSEYIFIDKGGPQMTSSLHVKFVEGEQTFRLMYRHDGQPTVQKPLTPFKGTNTLSPFVTLATRA